MEISKLIKMNIKEKNVILGYNRTLKAVKSGKPKMVIYAKNIPENRKAELKHNAKIAGVEIKEYPKDSVNLGLICSKPFPVSTLTIKVGKK